MVVIVKKRNISRLVADIRHARGNARDGVQKSLRGEFVFLEYPGTSHKLVRELNGFFRHEADSAARAYKSPHEKIRAARAFAVAVPVFHDRKDHVIYPLAITMPLHAAARRRRQKRVRISDVPKKRIILREVLEHALMMSSAFAITATALIGGYYYLPQLRAFVLGVPFVDEVREERHFLAPPVSSFSDEAQTPPTIVSVSDDSDGIFRIPVVPLALGYDAPKKYLVVFQNSFVPRPTGGALEAYAAFTLARGEISDFSAGNLYDIDAGLKTKVTPPRQLLSSSNIWGANSANWFFDFPTSARKIAGFFAEATGSAPDIVVAVDIRSLLKHFDDITDSEMMAMTPAQMRERITGLFDNVLDAKRVLADHADYFMPSVRNRTIAFFAFDETMQREFAAFDVAGYAPAPGADFYSVNFSSIDAAPHFYLVRNTIADNTAFFPDMRRERSLNLHLEFLRGPHRGKTGSDLYYLKIYLPPGAELSGAKGFIAAPLAEAQQDFAEDILLRDIERTTFSDSLYHIEWFEEAGYMVLGGFFRVNRPNVYLEVSWRSPQRDDEQGMYVLSVAGQSGVRTALRMLPRGVAGVDMTRWNPGSRNDDSIAAVVDGEKTFSFIVSAP